MTEPDRASGTTPSGRGCRACGAPAGRLQSIVDFGLHPHASSFPRPSDLAGPEPSWPLRVVVCDACWLVQLAGTVPEEPVARGPAPWTTAPSLERQARSLVEAVLGLAPAAADDARILEVASHGNYLQPLFLESGVRSTILERSIDLEVAARSDGLDVIGHDLADFAGPPEPPGPAGTSGLAAQVDILVDHYALAHHPEPGRAVAGLARLLAPGGLAILEFDSLLPSLERGEFDGFRHGHFAYWSLLALNGLLTSHGLVAKRATVHPVYGGVLRVVVGRAADDPQPDGSIAALLGLERAAGLDRLATYGRFQGSVTQTCEALRRLIDDERAAGGRVAAYGAPSRGNTLLNACAIGPDRLAFTVDRSIWKQGRLLPGTHLPIRSPDALRDGISLVVILTWDIAADVAAALQAEIGTGLRLAVPFPEVGVLPDPPPPGLVPMG